MRMRVISCLPCAYAWDDCHAVLVVTDAIDVHITQALKQTVRVSASRDIRDDFVYVMPVAHDAGPFLRAKLSHANCFVLSYGN